MIKPSVSAALFVRTQLMPLRGPRVAKDSRESMMKWQLQVDHEPAGSVTSRTNRNNIYSPPERLGNIAETGNRVERLEDLLADHGLPTVLPGDFVGCEGPP